MRFARKRALSAMLVIIIVASSLSTITAARIQSNIQHQTNNEFYYTSIPVTSLKVTSSARPTTKALSAKLPSNPEDARRYVSEYFPADNMQPKRTIILLSELPNAMINETHSYEDNISNIAGYGPTNATYSLSFHETSSGTKYMIINHVKRFNGLLGKFSAIPCRKSLHW